MTVTLDKVASFVTRQLQKKTEQPQSLEIERNGDRYRLIHRCQGTSACLYEGGEGEIFAYLNGLTSGLFDTEGEKGGCWGNRYSRGSFLVNGR